MHLIEFAALAGWGINKGELTQQQVLDELDGIVRPTEKEKRESKRERERAVEK